MRSNEDFTAALAMIGVALIAAGVCALYGWPSAAIATGALLFLVALGNR